MSTRFRYSLLALTFLDALGVFLVMDAQGAVSIYLPFVALYAACWVLVGVLVLHDCPRREKILLLGLFSLAIFSVHFMDWNGRKPFLKDFNDIRGGMTPAQVDRIMGSYIQTITLGAELSSQGEVISGVVSYRHTTSGWGDSDVGVLVFNDGHVDQKLLFLD